LFCACYSGIKSTVSAWFKTVTQPVLFLFYRSCLIQHGDSLVGQLRVRLGTDQTRRAIHLGESDWKAFLHDPAGLVTALVESVRFEGTTGTVSVTLRPLHTGLKEAHS